ncbi:MAG: sulfur carrier protein ThiS [Nitrospirota bacterium]
MKLFLNGEIFETSDSATIADLLAHLGMESGRVAVEVNLAIVRRAEHSTFVLKEGDAVEIVNFVGGG